MASVMSKQTNEKKSAWQSFLLLAKEVSTLLFGFVRRIFQILTHFAQWKSVAGKKKQPLLRGEMSSKDNGNSSLSEFRAQASPQAAFLLH